MTEASGFVVLPAIDLRGGRVVRLQRGDFGRETAYADDPVELATRFVGAGARWLHVVDLDGARTGSPAHVEVIKAIVSVVGDSANIEVAGGLRDETAIETLLALGASRAVVGTAALRDPGWAGRLVGSHGPERIVAAIDVRYGRAVGHGWSDDRDGIDAVLAIERLSDAGITTFEVTAIDRDGLLEGPDLELYERLVELNRGSIIASAGIASLDDIRAVRGRGCHGVIVGRALYEDRIDLAEAITLASLGN